MADAEYSAAILSRLKAQQDGMERLFKAIESGMADLADPARMQGVERILSALETGMADAVEALGRRDDAAFDRIAQAIGSIRMPDVNLAPTFNVPQGPAPVVQVSAPEVHVEAVLPPVPAPVVHIMPEPKGATWELRIKGSYGGPDRVMTLTRK